MCRHFDNCETEASVCVMAMFFGEMDQKYLLVIPSKLQIS